jgi:two-component system sensor histidine kinase DesK
MMSDTDQDESTGRPAGWVRLAAWVIPVLALRAAVPGPTGRNAWLGESPLALVAHREAMATGRLLDEDGLAANTRMMTRLQGGWRLMFVSVWLGYLIPTFIEAWNSPDLPWRIAGVTSVLVFAAGYVGIFVFIRSIRVHLLAHPTMRWAWLSVAGMTVLIFLSFPAAGESALGMTVYLAVIIMFLLPVRVAWALVGLIAVTVAGSSHLVPGWDGETLLSLQILVTGLAIWGIIQLLQRNNQLALAREEITGLAVSQERLRFSRDLHDILGHSLTVITLKAELAGRLIQADPARAEQEIAEVERLARAALADVRATAAGYRNLSLAAELASARSALDAAGIEAELPGAVDDVPAERSELFGWAVREGVTNVVRHSGARHCRVTVDPARIEIIDDGAGSGRSEAGNGLTGLRERAEAAGARLLVGDTEGGGFSLRVGW